MNNEIEIKRLLIELPADDHAEIKIRAARKNVTIKKWVLRAIAKAIIEENTYEKKGSQNAD